MAYQQSQDLKLKNSSNTQRHFGRRPTNESFTGLDIEADAAGRLVRKTTVVRATL